MLTSFYTYHHATFTFTHLCIYYTIYKHLHKRMYPQIFDQHYTKKSVFLKVILKITRHSTLSYRLIAGEESHQTVTFNNVLMMSGIWCHGSYIYISLQMLSLKDAYITSDEEGLHDHTWIRQRKFQQNLIQIQIKQVLWSKELHAPGGLMGHCVLHLWPCDL